MTDDFRLEIETEITGIFRSQIKGQRPPERDGFKHDGATGNWLESKFGIAPNNENAPDFKGYELKIDTKSKTTFGDWQADRYLFAKELNIISRDEFIRTFGSPNESKGGRYSWSGSCFPKVGKWNDFGQKLFVSEENDVFAVYRFDRDRRPNKAQIVPEKFWQGNVALAIWRAETLKDRLENKFNVFGWFSVRKGRDGTYAELVFGSPITFGQWIKLVRSGDIYLDSGMIEGSNKRAYSSWRANNSFWNKQIVRIIE